MFSFLKKPNTISVLFLILLSFGLFYKFFIFHLISIPADITVGMYYPWLDQKWSGLTTNVPVKNPLMSDIVSIIYQWRILSIDSLKNGFFPFWTQSYLSGVPLFANFQNSLINFTNIFFFFIQNNGIAWTLMVLSQLIFLLLSTYFCLRTLKFQKISSVIGSIVSSFSLFTIVWLEYGIHTYVAAFLPLFIICIEKYWQKKQTKFLVFLSFLIALQLYGGYPQYSIFSLIFISLYFIFLSPKFFLKENINFFTFISLGLVLSLPLLMPGYQLISRSIRQFDQTAIQDKTLGFLPLKNLLTLPIPNFFGNPTTYDYSGDGFYDNNAIFPGTIALISFFVFLILFFQKKVSKKNSFFLLVIVLSILISIQNPFSQFLKNHLGFIFSGNGISTRIFLLANFSFSVITAAFIDFILNHKLKNILFLFPILIWQLIILIDLFYQKNNHIAFKNTLYSLFLSLLVVIPLILIILFYKYSKKIIYVLLIAVIFEMFYYAFKYLPFSKSEYLFPTTPSIEYLQNNSTGYRIATTNTIPANMWAPYGLNSPDGYDTTMPLLNYEYYSLTQNKNFSKDVKRAIAYTDVSSNLYQNLSVKYKLSLGNTPAVSQKNLKKQFESVYSDKNIIIEENNWVLPKVHFVDHVIFAANKEEFKNIYSNVNFATNAILYSSDKSDFDGVNFTCSSDNSSNIHIVKDDSNSIIFDTKNNCQKLVFISNSFYPGWQAYIDETPTKIYQTNHAFQSVLVPAGEHQVILKYSPEHFKLYLALASFSIVILLIILLNPFKFNVKSKQ